MKTVCLTVRGVYQSNTAIASGSAATRSMEYTKAHHAERGVQADFFFGLHADKLGLRTIHPYELDVPGSGWNMGPAPTGCWISHRALWAALLLLPDEEFFVIEDDAKFPENWKERFDAALRDAPDDWDMIWMGSCCTGGKTDIHIKGDIHQVLYPLCTHGYVVRRRALPVLIDTQDEARCYAPIDISLSIHSMPRLHVYTVMPRILEQFETNLPV